MPFLGILVNGKRYDHSSVEVAVEGIPVTNVMEINYSESLEPGIQRGTSAKILGRSRGTYTAEGSITFYKADALEYKKMLAGLGRGGWGEAEHEIIVTIFEDDGQEPIVDTLIGCRASNRENASSEGGDVLTEVFTLNIIELDQNGLTMVSPRGGGSGIGGLLSGI